LKPGCHFDIQPGVIPQALKDSRQGKQLNRSDALTLVHAQGEELEALLAAAAELRDRHKG
jgi:hypothetical protein